MTGRHILRYARGLQGKTSYIELKSTNNTMTLTNIFEDQLLHVYKLSNLT